MKHAHADIIDNIGRAIVMSHFRVVARTIQLWKINGIPPIHHETFRLLGEKHGVDMKDL